LLLVIIAVTIWQYLKFVEAKRWDIKRLHHLKLWI
jgi:hypothetical protein